MASAEWLVETGPPRPSIQAIVQTDTWQYSTENSWGAVATLSILQGSLLMLLCTATFPVMWMDQNQTETLPQNRTYNPYLEEKGPWDRNGLNRTYDQYSMGPVQQYQSNLTIRDFSPGMIVVCVKVDATSKSKTPWYFSSYIRLNSHQDTNDSSVPRFLQGTFDKYRLLPTPFFRYMESKNVISAVYTVPRGVSVDVSVDTPDMGTLRPTNGKWNSSQADLPDITVETRQLIDHIHMVSLMINRGSYFHKGDYTFVIKARLSNGTEINQTEQFFLHLDVVDLTILPIEQIGPGNWSVLLKMQEHYIIRMYTQSPPQLAKTRLVIEERVQYDDDCGTELREWKNGIEICGVLGFSLFSENNQSQVGVQIVLRAHMPCVFTIITQQPSIKGGMDTVKSSIYTTTVDTDIPGMTEKGAAIMADPPLWQNTTAFTNETLSFHCYVPKCHLFWLTWAKGDDGSCFLWPPIADDVHGGLNIPNDNTNSTCVVYNKLEFSNASTTRIFTLTLNSLYTENSGRWICGYFSASPSNQHLTQAASIVIKVEDPAKPYFLDGKQDVQKQSLSKGGSLPLFCNVNGNPSPDIKWLYEFNDTSHTGATFEAKQPGKYVCKVSNKYGENNRTFEVEYSVETSYVPIAIAVPVAVAVLCAAVLLIWWMKRRTREAAFRELSQLLKNPPEQLPIDDTVPLNDQAHFIPYNRTLEINRDLFTITSKVLGEGEFGFIFKGEMKSSENNSSIRYVAVKTPRNPSNLQHFSALVDEMKVMCHIRPHVNVVALVGTCTEGVANRQLFVLTEFCENGSLKDYLVQNRMKFEGFAVNEDGQFVGAPGAVDTLLKYSYQAANGMTHLAAERIIHRDLALRNLLLTGNHIVKIADFGLSRQRNTFYRPRLSKDTPLPVFWMAPESIFNARYTQKSDVWSFGIVLWEMLSCGRRPYPDHCPDTNFFHWLRASEENRMRAPAIASGEMYDLMRLCWKSDPDARPTFSECKRIIARTLENKSPSMYQSTLLSLSEAWLSVSPENTTSSSRKGSTEIINQSHENSAVTSNQSYGHSADAISQAHSQSADTTNQPYGHSGDTTNQSYGQSIDNIYAKENPIYGSATQNQDGSSETYTMASKPVSPKPGIIPYSRASEYSEYSDTSEQTYL